MVESDEKKNFEYTRIDYLKTINLIFNDLPGNEKFRFYQKFY